MKQVKLPLFVLVCLGAAAWAFYLIGVHFDVVAGLEGGACGEGQGCGAVLQSEWSELFGVPVSAPAVPMYLMLAALGVLAARGKFQLERLAALASLTGFAGLVFGSWLLFHMLYHVAEVCRFCLIMDASNLAVLLLGSALHPKGLVAGLNSGLTAVPRLAKKGPEAALIPAILVGTAVLQFTSQPSEPGAIGETAPVAVAPSSPSPDPSSSTRATKTTSNPTASQGRPTAPPKPGTRRLVLPETIQDFPLNSSIPAKGPKDAPITIVVFEDFQCPYCKKLAGNVELLMNERPEQIRLHFVHFPMHSRCNDSGLKKNLHKFACNTAAASVCADKQGRFWELHDLLFRNNSRLRNSNLKRYAKTAGLDMAAWSDCMGSPSTLEKVKADAAMAAKVGVTGTPALLVNGRMLRGAQPVASLKAAINAILDKPEGRVLLDVEVATEVTGTVQGVPSTVTLEGPEGVFAIDAFEASLDGNKAVSRPGVEAWTNVSWYEAQAACEAAGKRLCTEGEWLRACTGELPIDEDRNGVFSTDLLQGRQHSYGEHWHQGLCADSRKKDDPSPLLTGNHPRCRSPEGVYDLEGVSKEWVGTSPDRAALKGGSYFSGASARCAYYKDGEAPDTRERSTGFRCCSGGAGTTTSAERFPGGKVGDSLRDWSGGTLDGKTLGTAQLKGRPTIMTFWATWCEPCKKELPALADLYEAHKDQGLQVVGINVDKDPAATRRYLKTNPLPFPVVLDSKKTIMSQFMTRGVPTTFWVKADGQIRQRTVGYDEKTRPKFEAALGELIGK